MKKIILSLVLFIVLSILQYNLLGNYTLKQDLISNFVTFLSIIFGFYITSLAIFVTSRYVSNLYKLTDKNYKSLTLLHILINNYKFGLIIILISIFYLLVIQFIGFQNKVELTMSNLLLWPFSGIVIFNFIYSYKMLSDLIKIIIQEAKVNNQK